MANIVRKNIEKAGGTAIIVGISSVLTELVCAGLAHVNVHVDSTEIKLAIVTCLSAAINAFSNWLKHRK
jgi:hypothetical protein